MMTKLITHLVWGSKIEKLWKLIIRLILINIYLFTGTEEYCKDLCLSEDYEKIVNLTNSVKKVLKETESLALRKGGKSDNLLEGYRRIDDKQL